MFFLYGIKSGTDELGAYEDEGTCPRCNATVRLNIVRESAWLTVFFVPCLPLSLRYYLQCPHCGASARVPWLKAHKWLAKARRR